MKKKGTVRKDASPLITEDRFWDIIERSEKGEKLVDVLCQLTVDEIFGYRFWWAFCPYLLYRGTLGYRLCYHERLL